MMRFCGALALALAACGPSAPSDTDGSGPGDVDAASTDDGGGTADTPDPIVIDAGPDGMPGTFFDDADIVGDGGCASTTCDMPVDDMCVGSEDCGADLQGDGLDNNCNGVIDEGCYCVPGDVRPCFFGQPGRRNVGSCEDGTMRCEGSGEFGSWGACEGGIWPTGEACDTQDNNCNGCADDHPDCCVVELACPGPGDLPEAAPFVPYSIDGTMFYSGPAASWSWTVVGGPCDQLLDSTSGMVSYTLTGTTGPVVTFTPTLSGDYTFTMTVTAPDGTVYTCVFIVHVRGPGFRVELCWDTTGSADIDLHVHRSGTTTPWFTESGGSSGAINADDCYYINCRASDFTPCPLPPAFCGGWGAGAPDWGYANTALAECSGTPDGATWATIGSCHNPRLDIDNIATAGIPENINVDDPADGDTFRTMVHHYGGSVTTHPMVNFYCGGTLMATYGAAPDLVGGFTGGGGYANGPMWRVADVTVDVDPATGVTIGCDVTALHPPGMPSGYWVTTGTMTSY